MDVKGCEVERRIEAFVKIQKKNIFLGGGRVGVWGVGRGGSNQGLGWGRLGSKVLGRWVMLGMGDVNQE